MAGEPNVLKAQGPFALTAEFKRPVAFVIEVTHRMLLKNERHFPYKTCAFGLLVLVAGCGSGGGVTGNGGSPGAPAAARFVPNYAEETDPQTNQPNRLLHWGGFPLRIHFAVNGNQTAERQALAMEGFRWWRNPFGDVLQFEIVENPTSAHIIVQFEVKGTSSYAGTTQYSYTDDSRLVSASISLNLSNLSNSAHIPATAAHEFGHALGIGGHSSERSDLMAVAPNVVSLFNPTLRDSNTMKTAYVEVVQNLGRVSTSKGTVHAESVTCGPAQ